VTNWQKGFFATYKLKRVIYTNTDIKEIKSISYLSSLTKLNLSVNKIVDIYLRKKII